MFASLHLFFCQLWNPFLIFDEFQCLPWLRHAPGWAWRLIGTASFDSSKVQEVALRLQRFRGEISCGKVDKLNTKNINKITRICVVQTSACSLRRWTLLSTEHRPSQVNRSLVSNGIWMLRLLQLCPTDSASKKLCRWAGVKSIVCGLAEWNFDSVDDVKTWLYGLCDGRYVDR